MEEKAIFYWEERSTSTRFNPQHHAIPKIYTSVSYSRVVRRMTNMLEDVHLEPDTANHIKVLWMPGPRYSCDASEERWWFPDAVIRLIETEISRCIQPQYLKFYLRSGWQNSKCLSTVLLTATILFLFQNVKELKISGGNYIEEIERDDPLDTPITVQRHMWGPETFYRFVKRLESHAEPECKILQKLESASVRWTTTSQTAFEFLEWLAALPAIKSIHADGISTNFRHDSPRLLAPRSSSLATIELRGVIHGTQTLQGILQAARSLESFIYHASDMHGNTDVIKYSVRGSELCSVLSELCGHSLKKLQTNLDLSAAELTKLPHLTHLWAPLRAFGKEIDPPSCLPRSVEHLVLPQRSCYQRPFYINCFVETLISLAERRDLPSLKVVTLVYPFLPSSDEELGEWIKSATKDLAEVGVDFRCVDGSGYCLGGGRWEGWTPTF